MKKIAITQRIIENEEYHEIRDCLDIKWSSFLKQINYLPILLPSCIDFKSYFQALKIDGIILSGGNDLGTLSGKKIDKERDSFERELISFAIENTIPVLGICRGMQIIGDYFGMRMEKVEGHVAVRHQLLMGKESLYRNFMDEIEEVNSYHKYGFRKAADNLIVISVSRDGVIEAMKHKEYPILGIMWHPEREVVSSKKDIELVKKLFGNDESRT